MSFIVKALFDYTSSHEDDLPFKVGQIITVTDEDEPDWYGGEYTDDAGAKHEGIFPRNFVERYEPQAPPRPNRPRVKKDVVAAPGPTSEIPDPLSTLASPTSPTPPEPPAPLFPSDHESAHGEEAEVTSTVEATTPPAVPSFAPPPPAAPVASPKLVETALAVAPSPPKPVTAPPKQAGPPPVATKPSSSAFRDRIAAFNQPNSAPMPPFKPLGSVSAANSGFIKKPFVAPPPSTNSYRPPPQIAPVAKIYRRDEDPSIKEQESENLQNAKAAGLVPATGEDSQDNDQPKPTTLKERIALLQKQQAETSQRHAEATARKEKAKRPVKKHADTHDGEGIDEGVAAASSHSTASVAPLQRRDSEEASPAHHPRTSYVHRHKRPGPPEAGDGNEADLSGAGDTTEGPDDLTERDESDERSKHNVLMIKPAGRSLSERDDGAADAGQPRAEENEGEDGEKGDEEEDNDEEDYIDPEIRRREELRARMAKMSGGMGFGGMFGAPVPGIRAKSTASTKKKQQQQQPSVESTPPPSAPPVPTMMALPGMSRPMAKTHEHDHDSAPEATHDTGSPRQQASPTLSAAPEIRPAPPPVPARTRPPPPLLPLDRMSLTKGSESDDERSVSTPTEAVVTTSLNPSSPTTRPPPPPPALAPPAPESPSSPCSLPRMQHSYYASEASPTSPVSAASNPRHSRLPLIPGSAVPLIPVHGRPPPPPPVNSAPQRSIDEGDTHRQDEEGEVTEYEGDYDTDIASSVPHKDALKSSHQQRQSSLEDYTPIRSPALDAPPPSLPPPIPTAAPRAVPPPPPPPPSQAPPSTRSSTDVPSSTPPPLPRLPPVSLAPGYYEVDETVSPRPGFYSASQASPRALGSSRRSADIPRPSIDAGFVANDIDLHTQSTWWLLPGQLPPQLQGRKDIYFESKESTGVHVRAPGKVMITRTIYVLFQDYSQTVIEARYDPQDILDVELTQQHEMPPRTLRQDELEQSHERFGRALAEGVSRLKDSVVGNGTPQGLVDDLLKAHPDALAPVGTRAYGALVYSNMANASTSQNDQIRPGDIMSIRNAKFQGKHGPMHAKYSMEVGKPDHVAVVGEWDGTKKKVRAWEQGRESKKVKLESFKLDDLRSGDVKIWRVMPRSWVGWDGGGGTH